MALVAPIALLIVVVGLGVAGRIVAGPRAMASGEAEVAVAMAVAPSRTPWATLNPGARPTVVPFLPLMPFVADQRETGTDGLMGRLPFDLPPNPVAPRVNRFTIDDVAPTRSAWDTTPPWVRRLGFLSIYRTDPSCADAAGSASAATVALSTTSDEGGAAPPLPVVLTATGGVGTGHLPGGTGARPPLVVPTTTRMDETSYSSQWRSAGWMSGRRRWSQSRIAQ